MNIETAFINVSRNIITLRQMMINPSFGSSTELKITRAEASNEVVDYVCIVDELSTQTFSTLDPKKIKPGPSRFEPGPSEISFQDIHLELESDKETSLKLSKDFNIRTYTIFSFQIVL